MERVMEKQKMNKETPIENDYYVNANCKKLDAFCRSMTEEKMKSLIPGVTYSKDLKTGEEEQIIKRDPHPNEYRKLKELELLNIDMGYNDFLSSILNPIGLEHGYDISMEGTYCGHRIFTQESMSKNPSLERNVSVNSERELSVHTIAIFMEKPVSIKIIDEKYSSELVKIFLKINVYSDNIGREHLYPDAKEPIILSSK